MNPWFMISSLYLRMPPESCWWWIPPFLFKDLCWCGLSLKSLLNLLQNCFCFYVLVFGQEACRILAPWPEIEPTHPALEGKVSITGRKGKSRDTPSVEGKSKGMHQLTWGCVWPRTGLTSKGMKRRKLTLFYRKSQTKGWQVSLLPSRSWQRFCLPFRWLQWMPSKEWTRSLLNSFLSGTSKQRWCCHFP